MQLAFHMCACITEHVVEDKHACASSPMVLARNQWQIQVDNYYARCVLSDMHHALIFTNQLSYKN